MKKRDNFDLGAAIVMCAAGLFCLFGVALAALRGGGIALILIIPAIMMFVSCSDALDRFFCSDSDNK